jgi:hypothetical protein
MARSRKRPAGCPRVGEVCGVAIPAGIAWSGEPRESVASGKCVRVASLSRGPGVLRRRSSPPSGMARLRCAVWLAPVPFPKTALRSFRGHALPSCLHGGPKPTPRPGEGGNLARRSARRPDPVRHGKRPLRTTALHASLAPAVRFGRIRKRLLPPASTRYAIRPAAEGGSGYAMAGERGKSAVKCAGNQRLRRHCLPVAGPYTSPLTGEVAAKRRVEVTHPHRRPLPRGRVTPPRSFAPTLPLKGRVGATLSPLALAPRRKTGRQCRQGCRSWVLLNRALAASEDR